MEEWVEILIVDQINKLMKKKTLVNKKIFIFGSDGIAPFFSFMLKRQDIQIEAYLSKKDVGNQKRGIIIKDIDEYKDQYDENIILLTLYSFKNEARKLLSETPIYKNIVWIKDHTVLKRNKIKDFFRLSRGIWHGYRIYKRLTNKYSGHKILIFPAKSGDAYLAGLFLKEFLTKNETNDYVLTVIGNASKKTIELFGIKKIELLSWYDTRKLMQLCHILGENNNFIKIMHFTAAHVPLSIMTNLMKNPNTNLMQGYKNIVYESKISELFFPSHSDTSFVDSFFIHNELVPKKTVILSPFANTYPDDRLILFWEMLASKISEMGYVVCTNSVGSSEPAIKDTIPINFPFKNASEIIDHAGFFIGIRNGLSDIICNSDAKKIVLYKKNDWGRGDFFLYHSFKKMGIGKNIIEIEYVPSSNLKNISYLNIIIDKMLYALFQENLDQADIIKLNLNH